MTTEKSDAPPKIEDQATMMMIHKDKQVVVLFQAFVSNKLPPSSFEDGLLVLAFLTSHATKLVRDEVIPISHSHCHVNPIIVIIRKAFFFFSKGWKVMKFICRKCQSVINICATQTLSPYFLNALRRHL